MSNLTVHSNNVLTLDGEFVGRISPQDAAPMSRSYPVVVYTGRSGQYDQPVPISAPLWIGSASDWSINPAFIEALLKNIGE